MMDTPRVSSALNAVDIKQIPAPLIIGERLNSQGSRKAKALILAHDYDSLVDIAKSQVEDGAHCIDVCVITTEHADEKQVMLELVKRISLEVSAPLVIDSTDPDTIEAAIKQIPGRPIINSINLEGDGSRFTKLAPIMAKYGVPAIASCIGPKGMAHTPQEKLEVVEMFYQKAKQYDLKPWQFIFDILTFTITTGSPDLQDSAVNTLDGIKLVKEKFPESFTVLGLSNISFGIDPYARMILNSVFLYHAVQYGLDCAIVNAKEIIPIGDIDSKERKLVEDLIFQRQQNALTDFITFFEKRRPQKGTSTKVQIDPSWSPGKRCNYRVVNRLKTGIEQDVVKAIAENISKTDSLMDVDGIITLDAPKDITHAGAIKTLNDDLLPAMKEVGEKFGSGELILPFVLKSAECMKAAVTELEKYLLKDKSSSKGKLVLGTVYGDVHDIGKNLVKTIVENNGYTVYDMGKQVPLQAFVDKINEVKPDAIGLSALLVSTSAQMKLFVEYARKNNLDIPILCGGAAINTNYINRIAKEGGIYKHGLFYCNTMFDGLKLMDTLVTDQKPQLLTQRYQQLEKWTETKIKPKSVASIPSDVKPVTPPIPPSIDSPIRLYSDDINLNDIWPLVDTNSLFKMSWGVRGRGAAKFIDDHKQLYQVWKERIIKEDLFEPSVVYGYFKCKKQGDSLLVYHKGGDVKFDFPRSSKESHLCLCDYFGDDDIVAFQSVTVGRKVADIISQWDKQGNYADAYYLHGVAVESAEALASLINNKIKSELNLGDTGGLRYSWGFTSCPDVSQHKLVWKLLDPTISGMSLTESGQIIPEQSTAAIITHHPDARYFTL